MDAHLPASRDELMQTIDESWSALRSFLDSVSEAGASRRDHQGWTISDHVMHLAVWEDSVEILFRRRPRHEALGIDEAFYRRASFDEINGAIRARHGVVPLPEAVARLVRSHDALMAAVQPLTDEELAVAVRHAFPHAPQDDDRKVGAFIYWNTADHFREHLPWMRGLNQGG